MEEMGLAKPLVVEPLRPEGYREGRKCGHCIQPHQRSFWICSGQDEESQHPQETRSFRPLPSQETHTLSFSGTQIWLCCSSDSKEVVGGSQTTEAGLRGLVTPCMGRLMVCMNRSPVGFVHYFSVEQTTVQCEIACIQQCINFSG